MKLYIRIIVTVIACVSIGASCTPAASDSVQIVSITPNSGLVDGNSYDFVAVVEYVLASTDDADLSIGFNNSTNVDSYLIPAGNSVVVLNGSGEHTFTVTATAKDWQSAGDFQVYVNMAEIPREASYTPLVSDTMSLSF